MKVYYVGNFWQGRIAAADRVIGMDVMGTYVLARSWADTVPVIVRLLWGGCTVERLEFAS
jgi:hypothetical protein